MGTNFTGPGTVQLNGEQIAEFVTLWNEASSAPSEECDCKVLAEGITIPFELTISHCAKKCMREFERQEKYRDRMRAVVELARGISLNRHERRKKARGR